MTTESIKPERLLSLDALRGFSMFWIIGGSSLVHRLTKLTACEWDNIIGAQMGHSGWAGFKFYDLIFPLFMFLAGVAIPYAVSSKLDKGVSRKILFLRILKRVGLLVFLGMIYNGFLHLEFEKFRFASVLGQIGIAYGIGATIVLFSEKRLTVFFWSIGIMSLYTAVQFLIPVPDHGAGILTKVGSINSYIDQMLLPGRLLFKTYDPEGLLCCISASILVLFGAQAGFLLRSERLSGCKKVAILAAAGVALLALSFGLSPYYPCIKRIWTTTFNLMGGGYSLLLLAFFYLFIDVWKFSRWSYFFSIIGVNSITVYLGKALINLVMLRPLTTALILTVLSLPLFSAEKNSAKKTQGLDLRLIAETKTITPGKPFTVGLHIHHHAGYHTYWKSPGIVGTPTSLDWTLPEGFTASAIHWPYPKKTSMAGHPCHGYERDITLLVTITPPQVIKSKDITLTAAAGWMCCAKNCFPDNKTFTLTLPVSNKILPHPDNAKLIQRSRQEIPISSSDCKASLLSGSNDSKIKVLLTIPKDATMEELYLFSFDGQISSEQPQQFIKQSGGDILLTIDRSEFSPPKNTHLAAVFKIGNRHLWINPAYAKK